MLTTCAQTGTNCLISSLSCGKQLEKNDLLRAWRACACKNFNKCQRKHANPIGFHLPLVLQLYRQTCKVEIKPHKCTTCNMLCRPGGLPILFAGWGGRVGLGGAIAFCCTCTQKRCHANDSSLVLADSDDATK